MLLLIYHVEKRFSFFLSNMYIFIAFSFLIALAKISSKRIEADRSGSRDILAGSQYEGRKKALNILLFL